MQWIKTFFEKIPGRGSSFRLIFNISSVWAMLLVTVAIFFKYCSWTEGMEEFIKVWGILHLANAGNKHFETRNNVTP